MTNPHRLKVIKDIVDDKNTSYAHAYLIRPHNGYAHMHVEIHMAAKKQWTRFAGVIKVSAQIGGDSSREFTRKPYAERYGFDPRYGNGELAELEQAVVVMRKIEKKMDELANDLGSPTSFADFCQRVLLGSGVKVMFASPYNWTDGGFREEEMEIFPVGGSSRDRLVKMEQELIMGINARRAA